MLLCQRYYTMNAVCTSAQFGSQMQKINGLDSIVLWFLDAKIEHRKKNVILHKSAIRAESSCFSLQECGQILSKIAFKFLNC